MLIVCVLLFSPATIFQSRHQLTHDVDTGDSHASGSRADLASSPELEERQASDYLSYNDAVAIGRATLAAVNDNSNQASLPCEQFKTIGDLENNGWSIIVEEDQKFPTELADAFKHLGLPTGPENVRQTAKNNKPFKNIKDVETVSIRRLTLMRQKH